MQTKNIKVSAKAHRLLKKKAASDGRKIYAVADEAILKAMNERAKDENKRRSE